MEDLVSQGIPIGFIQFHDGLETRWILTDKSAFDQGRLDVSHLVLASKVGNIAEELIAGYISQWIEDSISTRWLATLLTSSYRIGTSKPDHRVEGILGTGVSL